jgi:hypothetical protein
MNFPVNIKEMPGKIGRAPTDQRIAKRRPA